MRIAIALIGLAAICPAPATAGLFGPSNYDDCILENMKGVGDKSAAYHVAQACRSKFPDKKIVEKPAQPAAATRDQPAGESNPSSFTNFVPDRVK